MDSRDLHARDTPLSITRYEFQLFMTQKDLESLTSMDHGSLRLSQIPGIHEEPYALSDSDVAFTSKFTNPPFLGVSKKLQYWRFDHENYCFYWVGDDG